MQNRFRGSLFVSAGIILACAIVFGIAIGWFAVDIAAEAKKVADMHRVTEDRTRSLEILAQLKVVAPQIAGYKELLDSLLPTQDDLLVDFRRWFDGVSRAHHVVAHYSFEDGVTVATPASAGHIGLTIDAVGSYADITSFFEDLEITSGKFLMTIDSLDASQSEGGYRITARGKTYLR